MMTSIASLLRGIGVLFLCTEAVLAEDTHGCYDRQRALEYSEGPSAPLYYWYPKCIQGGYFQNVQCDFYGCFCAYLDTGARIPNTVENGYVIFMRETCPWTSQKPLDTCAMPPADYPCKKTSRKFYFNAATNKCEESSSSCLGFNNLQACEESCVVQTKDRCDFEVRNGTVCNETDPAVRWYHDVEQAICRPFMYLGCGGNSNNYGEKWNCLKACIEDQTTDLVIQVGNVKYIVGLPAWIVAKRKFVETSVIEMTVEQFKDIEGDMTAISKFPVKVEEPDEVESGEKFRPEHAPKSMSREEICSKKSEKGPCRAFFPRWYFDKKQSKCIKFIYGGCYGNENRHLTASGCASFCNAKIPPSELEIIDELIGSGGLIGPPISTDKPDSETEGTNDGSRSLGGNGFPFVPAKPEGGAAEQTGEEVTLGENEVEFEFMDE